MSGFGIIHRANQIALDIELAFANAQMVIALSSEKLIYQETVIFLRRYFLGKCLDGTEVLFVTTNEEEDYPVATRKIGEHYSVLEDFEALLDDLYTSCLAAYMRDGVHGPPKYIYYDIDFMDTRYKAYFSTHLESDICEYSEDYLQQYFDEYDMERIAYWIEHLENDFSLNNYPDLNPHP